MPKSGPGSAGTLKLPAGWPRTSPFLVWSWAAGAWWVVGHASDLDTARRDAAARLANTVNGTRGNAILGRKPIEPREGCRFIATTRDGDPQTEWEVANV
jgi:hypothetical protein